MADYTDWSEVKGYLDDPNISDDDKARILRAYADGNASLPWGSHSDEFWDNRDEIADYAERYGVMDHFRDRVNRIGISDDDQDEAAATYDEVTARADRDREHAQAVSALEDLSGSTVAGGGSGVATSGDLLFPGSRGMGFFASFIPQYREWRCGGPDLHTDIEARYDDLYDIAFAKFRADAAAMGEVHTDLAELTLDLSAAAGDLHGSWQGAASEAASAYGNTFLGHGRTVTDSPETVGTLISEGIAHIESAVLQRAQTVLGLWADTVDGLTPADISRVIRVAYKQADRGELRSVRDWPMFGVDGGAFSVFAWLFIGDQVRDMMADAAARWLDGTFVALFDQKKQTFDEVCASTLQSVGEGWDAMVEGMAAVEPNPFTDLDGGIQTPAPAPEQTPGESGPAPIDNAPGGPSTPGASDGGPPSAPSGATAPSGGGGGGPSGGGGGGGAPTAPASMSPIPGGGGSGTIPSGAGGGGGTPSIPELPTVPTPGAGSPTAPAAAADSVTIGDGKHKYTVTEPDAQGRAKLTVEGPNGKPKVYDLDFTKNPVTIRDGERTITATRTDNDIELTVDDGKGKPTTYTVDFNDPAELTGRDGAPDGQAASDYLSEVRGQLANAASQSGVLGGPAWESFAPAGFGPDGTPTGDRLSGTLPMGGPAAEPAAFAGGGGGGGGGGMTGGGGGGGGSISGVPSTDGLRGAPSEAAAPVPGAGTASGAQPLAGQPQPQAQPVAASAGGGAPSGFGGGGMPMGGGAGGNGSGPQERQGSKWQISGQFFAEEFGEYARLKETLEPGEAK